MEVHFGTKIPQDSASHVRKEPHYRVSWKTRLWRWQWLIGVALRALSFGSSSLIRIHLIREIVFGRIANKGRPRRYVTGSVYGPTSKRSGAASGTTVASAAPRVREGGQFLFECEQPKPTGGSKIWVSMKSSTAGQRKGVGCE